MSDKTAGLKTLLNAASDAAIGVSGGQIVFVNDAAKSLYGDLTWQPASDVFPTEALDAGEGALVACRVLGLPALVRSARFDNLLVYYVQADSVLSSKEGARLRSEAADHIMTVRHLASELDALGWADEEQLGSITAGLRRSTYRLWRRLLSSTVLVSAAEGAPMLSLSDFDLAQLCSNLTSSVNFFVKARGIELRFDGVGSLHCRADRAMIEVLLLNLITNSLQHLDCGGRIVFSLNGLGGNAVMTVTDNGSGISPGDMSGLFSGPGEGLRLARTISSMHGGSLIIESRENTGTSVSVMLPLCLPDSMDTLGATAPSYSPNGMELILTELSPWLDAKDFDPRLLD